MTAIRLTIVVDLLDRGGAETQVLTLVRSLDRDVVVPRLVCLRREGTLAGDFRAAGCRVDLLPRRGRLDTRLVGLTRLARRSDVVLVLNHQRAALTLGRVAAALAGVPSVVAVHDMGLGGRRSLPRDVVETLALSRALIVLAPRQTEHLRRRDGVGTRPWRRTAVHVVPNGVAAVATPTPAEVASLRADLGAGPDDLVVGMVGRLAPEKDHDTALRALARLDRPRVRLVIVGGGARADELGRSVAALGLTDRVLFTGAHDEARRLLPAFDVFLQSSRDEAVPLSVLEAMTAGLPVVCTDAGALPDIVADGHEGHVVAVGDDSALAAAIAALADDPARRGRLGAAAAERARAEYTATTMAGGYEAVLTEVVWGPAGGSPGRTTGRVDAAGPAVSFLCPAYRTETTLTETLGSVLAQRDPAWEIVVCDNGRSEDIARIVESHARDDDRVRLVRQENRGIGGGVDGAAAVARGRYVTVLASDDLVDPGYVGRLRAVLDDRPEIDAVVGDAVDFDDSSGAHRARTLGERAGLPRREHRLALRDLVLGRVPYYGGLVRREAWDAVGGFGTDDPGPPDLALWLRLVRRHAVLVIPEVHARIRVRPDSLSRAPGERESFESGIETAIERAVDLSDDPAAHAALATGLRRLRYLRAIRRSRWAFLDGDLVLARREARQAAGARPTPRAFVILAGLSVAPGLLRSVRPVKASLTRVASRAVAARRRTAARP